MGLTGFERRLERLVEGVFAWAFRSQLRPVELGRRAVREMDLRITLGVRGERVAPNELRFHLAPEDHERMSELGEQLLLDLADAIEEHARDQRYSLKGPAMVELLVASRLRPGQLDVDAAIRPGPRREGASGWLVLVDGTTVAIHDGDPLTIGRLPECDITLHDPNVSRRHAEVRVEHGAPSILDLGSLNGTKVNGRGVPSTGDGRPLVDGDQIQIGATTMRVVIGSRP